MQDFHNIEFRDAVLAYDGKEPDVDPKTGKMRTRWGGRMMKHPVTGEDVPNPSDQIPIYRYINARSAEWPEVDYIVSNPPFIGNARMREMLGDGYTETLRQTYKDVPETVDYVMYWWHKAAELVRTEELEGFGFITTNSIRQVRQRKVIDFHQKQKPAIELFFAIPDHPWSDEGAAVRISMTAAKISFSHMPAQIIQLGTVVSEVGGETPEDSADQIKIYFQTVGKIFSDLKAGSDVGNAKKLIANAKLSCRGMEMRGSGFLLTKEQALDLGYDETIGTPKVIKKYLHGRDITDQARGLYTIDLFGLSIGQVQDQYPEIYQWLYERVKPERDSNRREASRKNWWLYGETRATFRPALNSLERYIATVETAKHRTFLFLSYDVIPDNKLIAIALEDSYFLGVLSSKIHVKWSLKAGGWLGVGNDSVYSKTTCFDPFPFPDPTPEQKQKIRELGERLDAHRKRIQAQHPDVTITGMYNLLEKLRKGEAFTESDRAYNDQSPRFHPQTNPR